MITAPIDMAFSTQANDYLDHAQRKFAGKTYAYKAYVYREFLAFVGNIKVKEITIPIIDAYLQTRSTNINYNRRRKDLSALFNWGYRRRWQRIHATSWKRCQSRSSNGRFPPRKRCPG